MQAYSAFNFKIHKGKSLYIKAISGKFSTMALSFAAYLVNPSIPFLCWGKLISTTLFCIQLCSSRLTYLHPNNFQGKIFLHYDSQMTIHNTMQNPVCFTVNHC